MRAGEALVDFFFVLSGFVIAYAYLDRISSSESLARFMVTRLGRLYPLHLFMFGLFVIFECAKVYVPGLANPADPAFSGSNAPSTMLTNVLLMHSLRFDDVLSWNTPSWSISAEWICYILFGLAVVTLRHRIKSVLAVTVVVSPLIVYLAAPAGMQTTSDLGGIRALYSFAIGALLFCLAGSRITDSHRMKKRERHVRLSIRNWTILEIAVIALAAWLAIDARGTIYAYLTPLAFCALIAVFAVEHGVISRLMKMRGLMFLGTISYSLYMTHMFIQLRLTNLARLTDTLFGSEFVTQIGRTAQYGAGIDTGNLFAGDVLMAVMVGASIAVSVATYRWIERPGIAIARRLADRISAPIDSRPTKKGPREATP